MRTFWRGRIGTHKSLVHAGFAQLKSRYTDPVRQFCDGTLIEKLGALCRNYTYIQYVAIYIGLVRESLTNEKKSGSRLAFVYFVQTGQAQ